MACQMVWMACSWLRCNDRPEELPLVWKEKRLWAMTLLLWLELSINGPQPRQLTPPHSPATATFFFFTSPPLLLHALSLGLFLSLSLFLSKFISISLYLALKTPQIFNLSLSRYRYFYFLLGGLAINKIGPNKITTVASAPKPTVVL